MKLSSYNTYLNVSERLGCIYNALTDKTVIFNGNAHRISDTNAVPDSLRTRFIESGILIEDDFDEYGHYIELARKFEYDDSFFHLLLNPTLNCNFHCAYCYESHFPSKMNEDIIKRVKRLIENQYRLDRDLVVSFFGGEPMLYYQDIMQPVIEFAIEKAAHYNKAFSCNMTSNGFLLDENRIKWLKEHCFTGAQITLDGSKQVHNSIRYRFQGDNTFDTIVGNVIAMANNGLQVTLRLNCTNENIRSLNDISESFKSLNEKQKRYIAVDLHVVWQEADKNGIVSQMDDVVKSFVDKGIMASKMDFRGFCYADRRNECLVNYNGDVFKCTARDFATAARDGFIAESGEIIWENDSLNRRMNSKFKNAHCRECRIFPLCHGGCTTNSLEQDSYCMNGFSETEKDNVVKNRIVHNSKRL